MKIAILGGGGVRTPLLIYRLAQAHAALSATEVTLFDIDPERVNAIARLGREILRGFGYPFEIRIEADLLRAAEGAAFILSSIRVGGMSARARDERIATGHGLAGQETTGPGGAAMALRTLPVTLAQAQAIERVAPRAWFINFTNPAGLITQALAQNTALRVIGLCDTPSRLFHGIAAALDERLSEMAFDYAGLNHLGWIRRVYLRGEEITERILNNAELLSRLYPAGLFDPELIQALRLIPTEYLFFYYSQRRAHRNQLHAGASRGEELHRLNAALFEDLQRQTDSEALGTYRSYLMRRNASYLQLEGRGDSALAVGVNDQDPFESATGYHRIAVELMQGLVSDKPREMVLNVLNGDAIPDLRWDDVVEVPCKVDRQGARSKRVGVLPDSVRGLVHSVKAYERTLIRAALAGSSRLAELAMLECPIIGQWELAKEILHSLRHEDTQFLGYLR